MNALANSQLEELDKFVANVQGDRPVTFARYTGQEDSEERRRIAENPPDIKRRIENLLARATPSASDASEEEP